VRQAEKLQHVEGLGMQQAPASPTEQTKMIFAANVQMLTDKLTEPHLRDDLAQKGDVYAWTYLINAKFFERVFGTHLCSDELNMIVDHRQRKLCKQLQTTHPNLHAWSWSYNRTMHDKTFIFPALNIVYIGTYNLTQGSFWTSRNRCVRIDSKPLTADLLKKWEAERALCKKT
jgi:phosphatidylserine/phosphatidylglycerophosphate/cardiolipin synthase-like enzyme